MTPVLKCLKLHKPLWPSLVLLATFNNLLHMVFVSWHHGLLYCCFLQELTESLGSTAASLEDASGMCRTLDAALTALTESYQLQLERSPSPLWLYHVTDTALAAAARLLPRGLLHRPFEAAGSGAAGPLSPLDPVAFNIETLLMLVSQVRHRRSRVVPRVHCANSRKSRSGAPISRHHAGLLADVGQACVVHRTPSE